jgi:hypothetical protein
VNLNADAVYTAYVQQNSLVHVDPPNPPVTLDWWGLLMANPMAAAFVVVAFVLLLRR